MIQDNQLTEINFLEHAYDLFLQYIDGVETIGVKEFKDLLMDEISCSLAVCYFAGSTKAKLDEINEACVDWDLNNEAIIQAVINSKKVF